MYLLHNLIFFAALGCTVSRILFSEQFGQELSSSLVNEPSPNNSSCYERPSGKCAPGKLGTITGCSCTNGSYPIYVEEDGVGVVCAINCAGGKPCPPYPGKPTKCIDLVRAFPCGIPCSVDKDCANGGYCQKFGYKRPNMCMYRQ